MRLAVTVVSPMTGRRADVVITASSGAAVADVAAELDHLLHGEAASRPARLLPVPPPRAAVSYAGPGISGYGPASSKTPTAAAPAIAPGPPAAPALFVGYHRVPGDMKLAGSPIMDGSVVSIGDPAGCRRPEPAGVAELRVASGPAAGAIHQLSFGQADIGGLAPGNELIGEAPGIVIADPAIPAVALRLHLDPQGCYLMPADGVQVLLDREPVSSATAWWPGQQIAVGNTLLDLVAAARSRTASGCPTWWAWSPTWTRT